MTKTSDIKEIKIECPLCKNNYMIPKFMIKSEKDKILHCNNFKVHLEIKKQKAYDSVSDEDKKTVLDNFKSGMTIGKSYEAVGLTQEQGFAIIDINIQKTFYLRDTPK